MTFSTATIDNELTAALSGLYPATPRFHLVGQVRTVIDLAIKRQRLATVGTAELPAQYFVPDNTSYDVQLAHRRTGGTPVTTKQQFGSRTQLHYNLNVTLLVTTKHPDALNCVLTTLADMQEVKVIEFFEDSLWVLQKEFLFTPTQNTPYDPAMLAYAIRYNVLHADDELDTSGW